MATRHSDQISLTAAADLSAKQNLFAKVSGNLGTDVCGAGGDAIGTYSAQGSKAVSGKPAAIDVGPVVAITLAATLSAGAEVMSDANGKAVAWVTANRSLGYLLQGGVANDVVPMLFTQGGRKA
jgi:hypothetical protein